MNIVKVGKSVDGFFGREDGARHHLANPCEGAAVWSQLLHPVAELVVEVRPTPCLHFEVWHHYGDSSIAWRDQTAPQFSALDEAIDHVRQYQAAISAHGPSIRPQIRTQ